ncbi:peptidylprolyl isomerase [Rhizomonospora bruguierae]|uniref:peptidylprolyl isomerase n=1 Tax=Rhizomonospora bruguierae TaxID=1581705 RepID=UPI001BD133DC|nr:peptidylprolyl isomerase [Micromonospora sp. NBRC 107566]
MSQPSSVPPYRPDQYSPSQTPESPQRPGSRRGLIIGLVAGAVALLLCVCGVGVAGAVYYLRAGGNDSGTGGSATPPLSARSCGATEAPGPDAKAVGLPAFDRAPDTGAATMRLTTNLGTITVTMDRRATPCTVASFQHLADRKFFDRTDCHRLVTTSIFILQCGDPGGTGAGGPDYRFADENLNGARYTRGVVAMANAGPGTNGSQFFIVFRDSPLDPDYTPFGRVTSGLDVVDRVAEGGDDGSIEAGGGKPKVTLTIQTLTVE